MTVLVSHSIYHAIHSFRSNQDCVDKCHSPPLKKIHDSCKTYSIKKATKYDQHKINSDPTNWSKNNWRFQRSCINKVKWGARPKGQRYLYTSSCVVAGAGGNELSLICNCVYDYIVMIVASILIISFHFNYVTLRLSI